MKKTINNAPQRAKSGMKRLSIVLLILMAVSIGVMRFGAPTALMDKSVGTVPVGTTPIRVAVNPLTNKIYVANRDSGTVTVINGADNSTQTVTIGGTVRDIAVNSATNKIYVSSGDSSTGVVTVIDGTNNSTQTIAVVTAPLALAINPVTNKIYVAGGAGSKSAVTVIDGATNSTTSVPIYPSGSNPQAIALNPVTNKIYVANTSSRNVTVIDGTNNSVTTSVTVTALPGDIAVNSVTNKIYVIGANPTNTLTIIDGATNSTTDVQVGKNPIVVAVDAVANKIYVVNNGDNTVTAVNGADNSTTTVTVNSKPVRIAIDSVTNKNYVVDNGTDDVQVLDGTNNSRQSTVFVGSSPSAIAVNPVTSKIYVAASNNGNGNVTVIDGYPADVNVIDIPGFFVQQQYLDFLNRLPADPGFAFWNNQITSCNGDPQCIDNKRQNVSAAYFLSREFQETGFFVIKVQRVAFGKMSNDASKRITFQQFLTDARAVGKGFIDGIAGADQVLDQNKTAYVQAVVASSAFLSKYPTSLTASQYVDALYQTAGVTPQGTERQDAITAFGSGDTAGRASALRKIAESNSVKSAELTAAFVLLEYFGYLRRNPTDLPDTSDAGYQFWLGKLNQFNGDYIASQMVRSFIVSQEYRKRFNSQ